MQTPAWQFWIDVGGTFTDCLAESPAGERLRHKLLSSGITRGRAAAESQPNLLVDPARACDPAGFWSGAELRLLDERGAVVARRRIAPETPDPGRLRLVDPLPPELRPGQLYELEPGRPAPILAIRWLLGLAADQPLPPVVVRLGTTRGTNALLTRTGARVGLVTTRGLADVLTIGYQNRPRLFDLDIRRPPPLFQAVAEIDERVAADGRVLEAPAAAQVRAALDELRAAGCESLAICLLNAYTRADHEQLVARVARELGFTQVRASHEVSPLAKLVARGDTTVVDAYLNPVLTSYLAELEAELGAGRLQLMTSAGTLVGPALFSGKDSVLSGPAGGVVGFARAARASGFGGAIGFDMGGTSTDVARYDGRFELEYESEKAGVRLVTPLLAIETVAAGGGSVCWFDGVKLCVGPHSAGADPGPACYGRGGPLAVTDLNYFLGRLWAERFPLPLDHQAVAARIDELAAALAAAGHRHYSPVELCAGLVEVANAAMVRAIRSVSLAQGRDPRDYVLVAFGGAAGQHACAVARELEIRQVLIPADASLLSAAGLGQAELARHRARGVYRAWNELAPGELSQLFAELSAEARSDLLAELDTGLGLMAPGNEEKPGQLGESSADHLRVTRLLEVRYQGLDAALPIAEPAVGSDYPEAFAEEHRRRFGYVHEKPLEVVAARVEVSAAVAWPQPGTIPAPAGRPLPEVTTTSVFAGESIATPVYLREQLRPGDRVSGPALVAEDHSVVVVEPGWRAELDTAGALVLSDEAPRVAAGAAASTDASAAAGKHAGPVPGTAAASAPVDPVLLEVFHHAFTGIAERMGHTLRNTATSVNVKERLDFSCAIFDPAGHLVVNAPHIPVHLGAMGETVRRIIADHPELAPGDVFLTNDPYRGGSHLPDVTVITPVHDPVAGRLAFFTASRAHHAEIGGVRPGSMPPHSRNLAEEGVLLRGFRLVEQGRSRFDELERRLRTAPYPSRNVRDNLADVAAQVAANQRGASELLNLAERYSLPVVAAYLGHIQAAAERKLRAALGRVPPGTSRALDHLDDGTPVAVAITVTGDEAVIDFSGTGPVNPGNLNANRAIVTAAVIYVLRVLIDEDIPLNDGVLRPVRLVIPPGSLLDPPEHPDPARCAAVVGGNVEVSQRLVDVLLAALGLAAGSQGTMNNLLFGDAGFGYYETICGGAGATPRGPGASAVHTHMTNTRLTDPEIIEMRYPIRVREFALRRGSGGTGRHPGGDGVRRRLEFLRPLEVSLLTQRRGPYPPPGLAGGETGALGRQTLLRADGRAESLPALAQFAAGPGDQLLLETPGGGGYGPPHEEHSA